MNLIGHHDGRIRANLRFGWIGQSESNDGRRKRVTAGLAHEHGAPLGVTPIGEGWLARLRALVSMDPSRCATRVTRTEGHFRRDRVRAGATVTEAPAQHVSRSRWQKSRRRIR